MQKIITQALEIAKRDLRSCYTEQGIKTGSREVYWSWDSFFASFGSLVIGDFAIVKKNLKLYLEHQDHEGNIPKRIANPLYALKYIGLPISEDAASQKPTYSSPYYTGTSISQNPLLVVTMLMYYKSTDDKTFLADNLEKMEHIFALLDRYSYKSGLLRESLGGGWAESVLKRGAIAYTNMCYAESLRSMSEICDILGKKTRSKHYIDKYFKVKTVINSYLWDSSRGGFYSDWRGLRRHHYFNADGNLLSILWNIADSKKTASIIKSLDRLLRHSSLPLPLTFDNYSFLRIFIANRIGGMKDYHAGFSWLWLGAIAALVKNKLGQREAALSILEGIAKRIVKDNNVGEIYHNGRPVNLPFYKSEIPWAWSAGLFIYACSSIGIKTI